MRRSRIDIIIDILEISKPGATKTSLVYRANLNFKLADKYLELLKKNGLMENRLGKYMITEKGKEFLVKAQELNLDYSPAFFERPDSRIERRFMQQSA